MYICLCNALKEKDFKSHCAASLAHDAEGALAQLGCKAQCGSCADYIEHFVLERPTASSAASSCAS